MANDVTFATIDGSLLESQVLTGRVVIGAVVENIDASGASDYEVMFRAQAAIAAAQPTLPGHSNYFLNRIIVRGFMTNGCVCQVEYTTFQAVQPSTYLLRYTSYITAVATNLIPGTRTPIRVGWTAPPIVGKPSPTIRPDNVTMRFMLPTLGLSVSALVYGQPTNNHADTVAYVNDTLWPQGVTGITARKPGYWMLAKYETAWSKYKGYFSYEAVAISRVYADWSETGILRSKITGRFAKVDDSVITAMNALDYAYGYIYPANQSNTVLGVVRIGGNPVASMSAVFGFGGGGGGFGTPTFVPPTSGL